MFTSKYFTYVTLLFYMLSLKLEACLAYAASNQPIRRQIPFPLDQIFQNNAEVIAVNSDVDFRKNFGDDGARITQPDTGNFGSTDNQFQPQLPQIISNWITAAGVQQQPAPQQIVRTVMNSGLRR